MHDGLPIMYLIFLLLQSTGVVESHLFLKFCILYRYIVTYYKQSPQKKSIKNNFLHILTIIINASSLNQLIAIYNSQAKINNIILFMCMNSPKQLKNIISNNQMILSLIEG